MAAANVAGIQYSWFSMQWLMYGKKTLGITAFSVDVERMIKNVNAVGDESYGVVVGRKGYKASITVTMDTYEGMLNIAPERDITALPATDIIATYGKTATSPKNTITLRDAIPMKHSFKTEADSDDAIVVEIELFVSKIDF